MWIRTKNTEHTKKGLFNLLTMVALKVMEEPTSGKWCLKFPFDPGHPTIKSYDSKEEADVEFDKIADELEKVKPMKVMRI